MTELGCEMIEADEHGVVHRCGDCAPCLRVRLAKCVEALRWVQQRLRERHEKWEVVDDALDAQERQDG